MKTRTVAMLAIAMGLFLAGVFVCHADTTSFQEGVAPTGGYTQDAVYIRENEATVNQNMDPDQELIVGFVSDNTELRGLLEFDVSDIPAVDTIDTVSLVLRTGGGLSASITINVYEYDYDFDETTATWNVPDSGGSDVAGGTLGTLLTSATFNPTVSADITFTNSAAFRTAVTNALAGDGILRMILARSDASDPGTHRFARFDDETITPAGTRPELIVEHTAPPPSGTITWSDPGVSNITTNAAAAYATLSGTNAEVTVYWKEGTTNAPFGHTGWDGTNDVPPGLTSTGLVERAITNLQADTLYSFIFYGTNSSVPTNGWSDSVSFTSALSSAQTPVFTNATVVGASVTLGWEDNASNETAYILMRSTNAASDYTTITTMVANTESYVDIGLSAATYYYRLAATNSSNESVTDFAACQTNATIDVTAFQEGVLPTPAYTHDAVYIREGAPTVNQNNDGDQELIVGFSDANEFRGLLEFDISAIPIGNTVDSVSLVLRREAPQGGQSASITINVYEYDYDVDETTATWNAPDAGDTDVNGGTLGALLTSATFDPTVQNADVTFSNSAAFRTAVSDALADDGFLRLIIARSDNSGTGNRFARFDDETVTPAVNRPELLVSHQPPPAGTITWAGVGVSNITADAADAYATLGGADAEVTVYWKAGTTNAPFGHTGWSGTNDVPLGLTSTGLVERAITNLQADTLYTYVFYGTNSTPTNAWSSEKTFITALSSLQAPVFTSAGGGTTITLGWQDNASNETGYILQRSENIVGPYVVIDDTLAANTESYADSGLSLGTYYYRLAATNSVNGSVTDFAACQTNADVDVVAPSTNVIANYTFDGASATSTDSEPNSTAADFMKNPASSDWGFSLGGNVFARSTATTASEASAIADDDYFSFTVTPNAGIELDLAQLTFDTTHNLTGGGSPDTGAEMKFFVRSSVDNFTANIGTTYTQAWNTSTSRTLDLSGVSFQDVSAAIEFRFYIYDSGVDDFDNGARTDDVILEGKAYLARTTGFQEGVSPTAAYTHDGTWIHEGDPGINFNALGQLVAGPNSSGEQVRSLLEFDISAISTDDEIDSVALLLKTHATEDGSGGNNTFNVYAYGLDIAETTATWNAPDAGDTDVNGGTLGTLLTSATFDSTMKGLDITFGDTDAFRTAVSDAIAGGGFLRLIIANNDEVTDDNLVRFIHDEFGTKLDRPELLVIHTAPAAGTVFLFR